jgi:sortase A
MERIAMSRPGVTRGLERGLILAGILLLGTWFKGEWNAHEYQSASSSRLDLALVRRPGSPASMPRPTGRACASEYAGSVGRIEIPRLHLTAMIAEGTSTGVLDRAVGHLASTPLPGAAGNVGLAGHRDTFFRGLGSVRVNDSIRIVTPESSYAYRVEWATVVEPGRLDVLDATASPSVTLITCFPFRQIGPAPQRFVVRAVREVVSAEVVRQPASARFTRHDVETQLMRRTLRGRVSDSPSTLLSDYSN